LIKTKTLITSRRHIIVGAGGFGREVLSWFDDSLSTMENFFFLDDHETTIRLGDLRIPCLGKINDFRYKNGDSVYLTISNPKFKKSVVERMLINGTTFDHFIHHSSIVSRGATLGKGIIICPYSIVSDGVNLGDYCTVNLSCSIGHDVTIGSFTTLSSHVDITGNCSVGDRNFFGSGSRVLPGKQIGSDATVGAGAVVIRNISNHQTFYAPPAKLL